MKNPPSFLWTKAQTQERGKLEFLVHAESFSLQQQKENFPLDVVFALKNSWESFLRRKESFPFIGVRCSYYLHLALTLSRKIVFPSDKTTKKLIFCQPEFVAPKILNFLDLFLQQLYAKWLAFKAFHKCHYAFHFFCITAATMEFFETI